MIPLRVVWMLARVLMFAVRMVGLLGGLLVVAVVAGLIWYGFDSGVLR